MPTNLQPISQTSAIILSQTGTAGDVAAAVPFGVYNSSDYFLSGAAKQVDFVYKRLGGDVVDIELTDSNVYAAYEEAVLEYSYILNMHQGKNILPDALGKTTGTFDHKGDSLSGPAGTNLQYSKITLSYANKIGDAVATMAGFGGTTPIYSASFTTVKNQQDYDLQSIISGASATGLDDAGNAVPYAGKVGDSRVIIDKVFYRSPIAMWRFYGYYGGLNAVGNLSSYGQFADDSTFEVIPTWQNKAQAMAFEDAIYTRTSGFSYQLRNNQLRIFPSPTIVQPKKMWIEYSVDESPLSSSVGYVEKQINGVNNLNTLPYENVPYASINSIGKHWIRRYAFAVSKGQLGEIRSKFATVPIPGESVTLNGTALKDESKTEKQALRDELKTIMDELTYTKLAQDDQTKISAVVETFKAIPMPIYAGPQGSA